MSEKEPISFYEEKGRKDGREIIKALDESKKPTADELRQLAEIFRKRINPEEPLKPNFSGKNPKKESEDKD